MLPDNRPTTLTAFVEPSIAAPAAPAVVINDLTHRYAQHQVLDGVTLNASFGRIMGLLGPNGSGKTTLFRILSTLITPTSGNVSLDGLDLLSQRDAIRRRIGVVFQSPSLDKQLSAEENLRHHGHLYGLRGALLRQRIQANLQRFGLWQRRNERIDRFSGGMRRRIELAKGLLTLPRILILDEPSTGLDPAARNELSHVLREIAGDGVAVLLTTHLMDEADRCDELAILDQGKIVALGSPLDLRQRIGGQIVSIESRHPQQVLQILASQFHLAAGLIDGVIRFEFSHAHEMIPRLAEALPNLLDVITIGQPGLADVFIRLTGRRFDSSAA